MPGHPHPTLAEIDREAYIYFGAGAAVAWQLASPGVGRGVARHSHTLERPLDRLRATMTYIYTVALGDDDDRRAVRRMVDGRTLQVRDEQWPPDVAAFDRWWNARRAELSVDAEVRDYMHAVLRGGRTPWYLRTLLPLQRFVTRALLPPDLRAAYSLSWSDRDERNWRRFRRLAPRLYWWMPAWLRHLPARLVLRDFRRRQAR